MTQNGASGFTSSAVSVARLLRKEIMSRPDGDFLGSEEELVARLGLSKPTFRQTARLLEYQQLLTIKPGPRGGYFVRRPSVQLVSEVAATYLTLAGTTLTDLMNSSKALATEAVRLAALNRSPDGRDALIAALEPLRAVELPPLPQHFAEEKALMTAILDRAASPSVDLFLRTLYRFGFSEATIQIFDGKPERLAQRRADRVRLGDLILAGHAEVAAMMSNRQYELAYSWLAEDERNLDESFAFTAD